MDPTAPIGIFDSGIGGLTVAKAVMEALPHENVIYFGDTARVPYGIKSEQMVRSYALQITDFLLKKDVKMILIACNTVSATARREVEERAGNIPVLDVITAGTRAALRFPNHQHIGVIGTLATIGSGAYEEAIKQLNGDITITSEACPLLVPLAEEGWTDNEVAERVLKIYLERFEHKKLDSLILGCTHYPLFKHSIRKLFRDRKLEIVDSGVSIAKMASERLNDLNALNPDGTPYFKCYVSDRPQRFRELAERFLGHSIDGAEVVKLV